MSKPDVPSSPAFFAALVNSCNDAIITYDDSGVITSWNQAAETLFGHPKVDAVGRSLNELFSLTQPMTEQWEQLRGGYPQALTPVEIIRHHRDGKAIALSISISPIQADSGEIIGFSEIIRETPIPAPSASPTPPLSTPPPTHNSPQYWEAMEALFEQAPMIMSLWDGNGRYLNVNRAFADQLGCSIDEIVGRTFADFFSESVVSQFQQRMQQLQATGQPLEVEDEIWIDNQRYIFHSTLFSVHEGGGRLFWAIAIDVTARKQAVLDLQTSEANTRTILNTIPDLMYIIGTDGTYRRRVRPNTDIDLLHDIDDPVGSRFMDVLPPENVEIQGQAIQRALQTGAIQVYEQAVTINGVNHYEEVRITKSAEDEVLLMVRDISDRKRAEQERHQAEQRLRQAQRIARLGNWRLDHRTCHLSWSDEMYGIFEQDPGGFQPSCDALLSSIHPADRDRVAQCCQSHRQACLPYDLTYRILLTDGRVKYVHEQCETDYDADGNPTVSHGITQDITECKQAELALKNLFEATAATTGDNFFPALVSHISQALEVTYALVTKKVGNQLESLALCANNEKQPSFTYLLGDTPCGQTFQLSLINISEP
ncbi:MAG: PAS domain S-box protein, partial [Leptolyngbyaceae cyanobacterium]